MKLGISIEIVGYLVKNNAYNATQKIENIYIDVQILKFCELLSSCKDIFKLPELNKKMLFLKTILKYVVTF